MIYVYDTVLQPYESTLKRYGVSYRLEKVSRMGEQRFFTFTAPGHEKILVVPRFAEQYRHIEKLYQRFASCRRLETCLRHIKQEISRQVVKEEVPNDQSANGVMIVMTTVYADIQIQFEFMNNTLRLNPEFEILENNLFGNNVIVIMNLNMEGES